MAWMLLLALACFGMDTLSPDAQEEEQQRPPLGGDTELDSSGPDTGLQGNTDKPDRDTAEEEVPPGDKEPVITAFAPSQTDTKVRFNFGLEDPDEDLQGGEVRLDCEGLSERYTWPSEIRFSEGGAPFVLWELDTFEPEEKVTCELEAEDSAGNQALPVTAPFIRSGNVIEVSEGGDGQGNAEGIGRIPIPTTVRGDMYATGNNGYNFTGDIDFVKFSVESGGSRTLTLNWTETGADYDLYLLKEGGETLEASATYDYPESVTFNLQGSTTYFFAVAGWSGAAGEWTVRIE